MFHKNSIRDNFNHDLMMSPLIRHCTKYFLFKNWWNRMVRNNKWFIVSTYQQLSMLFKNFGCFSLITHSTIQLYEFFVLSFEIASIRRMVIVVKNIMITKMASAFWLWFEVFEWMWSQLRLNDWWLKWCSIHKIHNSIMIILRP